MKRAVFKFRFNTAVHFGAGALGGTDYTLHADTLYSALYIEAVKSGSTQRFYAASKEGGLLISDAFPYSERDFFLPKPMIRIKSAGRDDVSERKKYKKLQYVPASEWDRYLKGGTDIDSVQTDFGRYELLTRAAVSGKEETLPYQVGTFTFFDKCGLYFILMYEDEDDYNLMLKLLELLSYSGIGGKRSSGLGRFEAVRSAESEALEEIFGRNGKQYMLLSGALPKDEEGGCVLEGASYLLEKRSGFVASENYAPEWRKKKDMYIFKAGSCFNEKFAGDIYDVSDGGRHPVYRYAKGMFLGI